jgi:hypothetical protein
MTLVLLLPRTRMAERRAQRVRRTRHVPGMALPQRLCPNALRRGVTAPGRLSLLICIISMTKYGLGRIG